MVPAQCKEKMGLCKIVLGYSAATNAFRKLGKKSTDVEHQVNKESLDSHNLTNLIATTTTKFINLVQCHFISWLYLSSSMVLTYKISRQHLGIIKKKFL